MTDDQLCKDGEPHHWVETVMPEDGLDFSIVVCPDCGYWR